MMENFYWSDSENVSYPFSLDAECTEIHEVNESYHCWFAMVVEDCTEIIEYIDYNYFIFCHFGLKNVAPSIIICIIWLLILFVALGITSNCFLCPALFAISKHLGLSQNVAGVTLLAFGNGSPDIFSSAASLHKASAELAISSLVGAGTFVTTVVAGSVFLTQSFSLMVRPFLRDVFFYLIAVGWTFGLFFCSTSYPFHGIGLVVMYFVYIIVVLGSRFIYVNRSKNKQKEAEANKQGKVELTIKGEKEEVPNNDEADVVVLKAYFFSGIGWFGEPENISNCIAYLENPAFVNSTNSISNNSCQTAKSTEKLHPVDKDDDAKERNSEFADFLRKICPINLSKWPNLRWYGKIAAFIKCPAIFVLRITVPVIDETVENSLWNRYLNSLHCITGPFFITLVSEYAFHLLGEVFPVVLIVLCLGSSFALLVFFTSERRNPPVYHSVFAYLGFTVAVTWIYALANEIVALLQVLGVVFNLSDAVLGLTILAWGNSLSDYLSNLAVARKGYPRMGISACFGGPLLALLLGLGIPLIVEMVKGRAPARLSLLFSGQFVVLFVTLAISLVMTTAAMSCWKFKTRRWYGVVLILLYVAFVTLSLLEEFNVLSMRI